MRSVCLLLMVISQVQLSLLCPFSCVVCSEDVIICHKLLNIIDAPGSTKALMLTDGLIDSVDNMVLSELSNMSVLALSNNAISSIMENAFQNLSFLTTLLLDHNRISSQSLDNSTFSWLHRLETLQLGNNNLNDIDGSWFQSSKALKTLQLEGNLLNCLNSTTFAHADLRNLETLDLSNNLIVYLGRDSFRGLPRLRRLDLSRNHLRSAPDAFSYLSWLSVLNLDLNLWSCTCELRELASFLNSYIQAPEKVLYNGQRMVCVKTDNAAVQAVLELTDANCVPPNRNISMEVVAKRYNTSEQYIRNVAIAVVFSFLGGVGITLGMIAIAYHKLSKKFELVLEENRVVESGLESTQWNFCEGKGTLTKCHALYNSNYKSHQPWDREDSPYLGSDMLENHFTCHKCSSTAHVVGKHKREIVQQKATHVGEQLANHQHEGNDQHSVLQQRIKEISAQRHNDSGAGIPNSYLGSQGTSSQHHGGSNDISAVRIRQLALSNHLSALQRGTFRPPDQIHNEITQGNHSLLKHPAEDVGAQPIYQTISCLHCHQTYEYRQAGSNNQNFTFTTHSQNTVQNGAQIYNATLYKDNLGYDKSNAGIQATELGFKLDSQRSVTFDLAGTEEHVLTTMADRHKKESRMMDFKTSAQKTPRKLGKTKNSTQGHLKTQKTRGQAKRTLKVKFNLNPLRKSRVHPKSTDKEDTEEDKMYKKGKREKLKSKKDKKDKLKINKTSKKSKDNLECSGSEEEENYTMQDISKKKRAKKGNKESKSLSKDTDDVTIEKGQNYISVQEETQMASTPPLTLSLALPDDHNSLTAPSHPSVLDSSDTQQLSNPNIALPVSESTAPQDVVDQTSSSDLISSGAPVIQEYVSSAEGSPKRKLRLILPEKTTNRPQTALDKKIR
ncbi:uncharacterized protein lrrc53 [Onychostoma macrolepis]|uniref:Leucine rich repeat containing 53 n=1 Tax=Onychostoma macrolepis TaxID=369639 RepID=A0A7J6DCJ5_9TELE|nr:uncharacterized protein lrrc53 [Onychostoma macrolepis]XP_058653947.1 uncharacterized protein lrrc53 [Onychostoma macrolepis]KAF4117038.1 hypothetical protein G5714_001591 [Onychostoma macrolepis]